MIPHVKYPKYANIYRQKADYFIARDLGEGEMQND